MQGVRISDLNLLEAPIGLQQEASLLVEFSNNINQINKFVKIYRQSTYIVILISAIILMISVCAALSKKKLRIAIIGLIVSLTLYSGWFAAYYKKTETVRKELILAESMYEDRFMDFVNMYIDWSADCSPRMNAGGS